MAAAGCCCKLHHDAQVRKHALKPCPLEELLVTLLCCLTIVLYLSRGSDNATLPNYFVLFR